MNRIHCVRRSVFFLLAMIVSIGTASAQGTGAIGGDLGNRPE